MKERLKKWGWSNFVILLVLVVCSITAKNLHRWGPNDVIVQDVVSYYSYLPATFIYGDATLKEPNEAYNKYDHEFWLIDLEGDHQVIKTSIGMSIMYAPFFTASHTYAKLFDYEPSGYSAPYRVGIILSSLVYFLVGMIFLKKVLRLYFNDAVTAITILLISLGTNFYFYVVLAPGYAHNYVFCLLIVTVYLLHKWHQKKDWKTTIVLGLLLGLVVLVRPIMILVVLFALLMGVVDKTSLKSRIQDLVKAYPHVLAIGVLSFIVWIPQLLYWKAATGHYWFFSYTGERFFWSDPKLLEILFSFRKGWLIYTPIMLFSIIGLIWMVRKKQQLAWGIGLVFLLYLYVASCWWDWWFGGSFGYRTMIDIFPLLAVPLGFFVANAFEFKKWVKTSTLGLMFVLLAFNLFQTRQAHEGLIHHDSMTIEAYGKIFLKLKQQVSIEEVSPLLDKPDYDAARRGERDL